MNLHPQDRKALRQAREVAGGVRDRLDVIARNLRLYGHLPGCCHFAAVGLADALVEAGLQARVAATVGHSFAHVELPVDGHTLVVDVTASQYGLPRVYTLLPWKRAIPEHRPAVAGGEFARAAAKFAAGVDFKNVPDRWWAIPVEALPSALDAAGTMAPRLTIGAPRMPRPDLRLLPWPGLPGGPGTPGL